MKKKLIIVNSVFIGICFLFLVGDFSHILSKGFISMDGRISMSTIMFFTKLIFFTIGFILLNINMIKGKVKLAYIFVVLFIILGIVGANLTYDKYNEATSDVDWFSDGIN